MAKDAKEDLGENDPSAVSLELPTNDHRKDLLRKTDLRELQTYEEETPRKEEKEEAFFVPSTRRGSSEWQL